LSDGDDSIDAAWEEISRAVVQTVRIGSRVLLQDESGTELLCTVTAGDETDIVNGGRRPAPSLLRALLGRRVGEEVHVWTSQGGWSVTILEVD